MEFIHFNDSLIFLKRLRKALWQVYKKRLNTKTFEFDSTKGLAF